MKKYNVCVCVCVCVCVYLPSCNIQEMSYARVVLSPYLYVSNLALKLWTPGMGWKRMLLMPSVFIVSSWTKQDIETGHENTPLP